MYSIPELYSTDNYLCEIDDEEIEICKEHATFRSGIHCDEDIYNILAKTGVNVHCNSCLQKARKD
ncbi:hypothetical protein KUTeg_006832 [Tegillarca granosa]|uniref:Uncharacterized protein n=1 Tax=Tegillarca granosa TaxID=220873 RepID=A0ABQ9FFP6_TEGGR|nr:hypothetical protein KUTeg_006832 [Tegillarca granosa]